MARQRDPKRDQALEIFIEHNGEVTNRKVASLLSVPEKTISAWKSRDKWSAVLQNNDCSTAKEKCSTTNKGGAPRGNQNAKGNKGNQHASPPEGNKNAVKTGEYEKLYFDLLSEDEKSVYLMNFTSDQRLEQDIRELSLRKYRMMKRITSAEDNLNESEMILLHELRDRKRYIESNGKKIKITEPELIITEKREKISPKIDNILRLEDALTRISNQLAKSLKLKNELELSEKKKALIEAQARIASLKADELELEIVPQANPTNDNDEVPDDIDDEIAKLEQELGIDHNG
ncbi:small subunit of terminase [Enterococcus silesiacus]|uniref:Small subunit of terminase n=1 Tax=Enterococcus silesiacus TaxID=332949 RepID=A0A0S3KFQ6_9ENTE|nr:phage terminase small subunit [Enterococcus silesiacus]ALS03090.1 small subunit of terminase [Enterococcus silesiacus]OJG93037.1 hypothetical protein RV15_GL002171 [Enterococcus silesiacus]